MSKTRTKIHNSIIASKIDIDYKNFDSTKKQIEKQLSQKEFHTLYQEPTIYHMDSLYRDNTNDKYELINQ
jgi:methionyl-tRNA synthetase